MTKQISRELLKKIAARVTKKTAPVPKKMVRENTVDKVTSRRGKTRRKKTSQKRISYSGSKVTLHPKVKALIANIKTKEPHGIATLKKFGLKAFRELLAIGCKKCKGSSLNKEGNYCDCINEIAGSNFVNHCDQYYVWYYACVSYPLPGEKSENSTA